MEHNNLEPNPEFLLLALCQNWVSQLPCKVNFEGPQHWPSARAAVAQCQLPLGKCQNASETLVFCCLEVAESSRQWRGEWELGVRWRWGILGKGECGREREGDILGHYHPGEGSYSRQLKMGLLVLLHYLVIVFRCISVFIISQGNHNPTKNVSMKFWNKKLAKIL